MKVVKKKLVDETGGETEGARRASAVFPAGEPAAEPPTASAAETGVVAKGRRRRFTAEYKRRIAHEVTAALRRGRSGRCCDARVCTPRT